jgi:hypothetical protein
MVYLKHQRKYKGKNLDLNSTDSLELPEAGILSAIQIEFNATNATGLIGRMKQRIIDHITAIEVTDGGTKKIYSLTGQETKALDFYTFKDVMPESAILYDSNIQRTTVVVPFGEYIGDPKHALDLSAFDQVNIDITNDASTSDYTDDTLQADVKLLTIEDLAAKPPGYYKHYEWKSETPSAAAQYISHKVPTTDKIRRMMVQFDPNIVAANAIPEDVTTASNNIKLYFNERTQTVLDYRPKDLFWANCIMYGKPETFSRHNQSTTIYADSCLGRITNMPFGTLDQGAGGVATGGVRSRENNLRFWTLAQVDAGVATNQMVDVHCVGEGYYDTAVLFDSYGPDEATFLDPSKSGGGKGPVEIEWYASAAAHKLRTFLTVPQKQGQA